MANSKKLSSLRSRTAAIFVALLRGVNVGGKNRLPMAGLADVFGEIGCVDVRTYIQSGNVVFAAPAGILKRMSKDLPARIAERFGFRTQVLVRTADEFAEVVAGNPFAEAKADTKSLHVAFLAETIDPQRVARLDAQRSPGDAFVVRGREIYLHLPNGVARSRLTASYFDAALATTSTTRNWRTVLKLLEMVRPA